MNFILIVAVVLLAFLAAVKYAANYRDSEGDDRR